jgi:Concanavalin A-like lectin/glucanases superfamily
VTTTGGTAGSSTTGGGTGPGGASGTGGSDAPDAGTPNVDATAEAAADTGAVGCAGHALQLEGIGYLQVTRMVQDDFTLEAWIRTTTSYSGTNFYEGNGLIYADVGGTANDFGSSILSGQFAFGVGNPDTTITSTTMVTTGDWVHVAATRRKSTGEIQVFVNGHLEASKTVAQTASLTAQTLMTIGANSIDGKYYNGMIDEVRIWNVVRSETEITGTLHKTLAGNEPGLVAYYRLDESSGTSAADSSTSQSAAALTGEGTWIVSDAPTCP